MDKSAMCIDQFAANSTLATGSMDRTISLWDTREGWSHADHLLVYFSLLLTLRSDFTHLLDPSYKLPRTLAQMLSQLSIHPRERNFQWLCPDLGRALPETPCIFRNQDCKSRCRPGNEESNEEWKGTWGTAVGD